MTANDYFIFAHHVLQANVSEHQDWLTAAQFSLLLRGSGGGAQWETFGFSKFKDFLVAMEQQSLLRIFENEKQALSVGCVNDSGDSAPAPAPRPIEPKMLGKGTLPPLRKPFWAAFAFNNIEGRRQFDRRLNQVRFGEPDRKSPDEDVVSIEPISDLVQKQWAGEFLERHNLLHDPSVQEALGASEWYTALPRSLAQVRPDLATSWNRFRSQRVIGEVLQWCEQNHIPPHVAFLGDELGRARESDPSVSATFDDRAVRTKREAKQRQLILEALRKAPTDFLLGIPIPAKFLFEVLQDSRNGK